MSLLSVAVALVGALGALNLLLVLAVVRRLREHGEELTVLRAGAVGLDPSAHLGRPLPRFEAVAADGRLLDDSALRGRRSLVGFFAVGCEPCHEQAPAFAAAAAAGDPVLAVVVGASSPANPADPAGDLPALLAGVDHLVLEGMTDGLADRFGIQSFPTLLEYAPDATVTAAAITVAGLARPVPA